MQVDISVRYIGTSIPSGELRVDVDVARHGGRRRDRGCPRARTLRAVRRSRRLRAGPPGRAARPRTRRASTRLDVCDAHPELLRAARNVGEPADDDCPVCGAGRPAARLLRLRRRAQPGQRPLHRQRRASSRGSARRSDEFACYVVEVCLDCRWNHLRRQRCTAAATPLTCRRVAHVGLVSRVRGSSSSRSAESCGYCEQHEMHHSSARRRRSPWRAGPTSRAARTRAGRAPVRRRAIPQFSHARSVMPTDARSPSRQRGLAAIPCRCCREPSCPGRWRYGDGRQADTSAACHRARRRRPQGLRRRRS